MSGNSQLVRKCIFALSIVFISQLMSCAALESTYKPHDFSGGYGEEKLGDNAYIVYFDANGFTHPERSREFFLRRSSQLTLRNDFDCFVVIEEKKTLNSHYITSNKLAKETKYFSSSGDRHDIEANKFDENSLSGIIQIYRGDNLPANCIEAKVTSK